MRTSMAARRFGSVWFAAALTVVPAAVWAQTTDAPVVTTERRIAVGGDLALIAAPPDTRTYFNYTSYDQDGLRTVRVRLDGEWHLLDGLSLVGELRTENTSALHASAFYLRWQPGTRHDLSIQIGRIPPVIGAFGRRAYGRDNAVLGLPLAYQYLTSLRPDALPASAVDLLAMRGRGWQPTYPIGSREFRPGVPLVSGSSWDTGTEGLWTTRRFDLAGAVTLGSPADPLVRETNGRLMWSGRAAAKLPAGVTVGVSGARAGWLQDSVLDLTPEGRHTPDTQSLLGVDTEFGVGRWLVRAEWLRSRFDLPLPADPSPARRLFARSGFVEGRVKLHPRLQVGVRVDRLRFSTIQDPATAGWLPWDANVDRVEAEFGVRLTRPLELRAGWQQNWRPGSRAVRRGIPVAGLLYWF
jgi:hypothetical protein